MSEMRHTPGPWELTDALSIFATSPWNARVRIAEVIIHSPQNGIDGKANAKLIAAAPDLYAALRAIVAPDGMGLYATQRVIEQAEAALAKATA